MARSRNKRRQIFDDLKTGEVEPLYYLHGPDGFMLKTAVEAIIEAALPEGPNDFNFEKFRGNDTSADAVRSAAETLPFMTERRVVVVQDVQEMPSNELDDLKEYFKDPSSTTCMIVAAMTAQKKLDGRTSVVKALRKSAAEYEFKELREREVGAIIKRNARPLNLELDQNAVAYLVEALGTDMAALVSALEKIDLYVGTERRRATVEDCRAIVADTRVKTVFDLTEALGARKFGEALKILDRMLVGGESPIGITAMIARHFRIVGRLQDPSVARMKKNEAARRVGVHPFFLKEYQGDARRFTRPEVETLRRRLTETDLALKSSRLADRVVMEGLLYDICNRPRQAV
jgi:DNA polymerase-3 subunit delta